MLSIDYLSAFFIGLLGSAHCIGMCGGITTMLTSALTPSANTHSRILLVVSYHTGRIVSYSLIGAIIGFTSSMAVKTVGVPLGFLRIFSAIFLILLGLYLGQWLMVISKVERIGTILWKHLSPISKKLIPVKNAKQALALGGLWGWLPCGLVYSTLTWSLASGNAIDGALIMTFFGLGTLPALAALSFGVLNVKALLSSIKFRRLIAILIILYGLYSLYIAYRHMF